MSLQRGLTPTPRYKLASATPYSPVYAPPAQFLWPFGQLSMWGNDVNGDCVTAEEAAAKACNTPGGSVFVPDATVIAWAQAHGVLNGANIPDVSNSMVKDGFIVSGNSWDDGSLSAVDYSHAATLQAAINVGPVKIGIAAGQLQATCEAAGIGQPWFATGYIQDSNEDHCVSLFGYGPITWLASQLGVTLQAGVDGTKLGYALFTWSTVGLIDEPSLMAIIGEAWVRNPTTVEVGPEPAPNPNPTPVPTPTPPPAPSGTVTMDAVVEAFQFLVDLVRQGRVTDQHMLMMGQFLVDLVSNVPRA